MIVLDASVLIGFLDSSDGQHEAAVGIFERNPSGYLIHPLTAAEVLVGPAKRGMEGRVWQDLSEIGVEIAELGPDEPLTLARLRAQWGLTMPDTCVLATAKQFALNLATFDRRLASVATRTGHVIPDL